jgi:hypothetical protein
LRTARIAAAPLAFAYGLAIIPDDEFASALHDQLARFDSPAAGERVALEPRQSHEGLLGVEAIEQGMLIRPDDADQLRCQTFFGCNGKIAIVQC